MADTPVGSEAARKAALVAQVASWKVKEAARLEKRRRDRLVVSGAARETTVGSSRGSSPGITNTRSAGRQNGSYQGASFTQDQFSGGQKQGGALLFRPEEIQHLPGPFSEEERNAWELDLADEWDSMNKYEVGTPEFLTARQWIEDFSQVLQTRIRNSNPIANRQSEQIQQMKQNLGFNARGTYNFNTRTAMQTSSLPASSNPEYRPTYTRMARRHLSVETLRHFNVDFRVDEVKLWEHTRDLREIRRSSLRFVESASPRPPSRSSAYFLHSTVKHDSRRTCSQSPGLPICSKQ
ncbi:hypothetical protein BKA65DRAFT_42993 [Rhexocercosporidium sp. MPI-PUGE-AT-0058]|nr:hypothetical protein BKA65DRAFT_42993 [Rhexocercosporidium sp. MPI-PUGE-AT-0058]